MWPILPNLGFLIIETQPTQLLLTKQHKKSKIKKETKYLFYIRKLKILYKMNKKDKGKQNHYALFVFYFNN